MLTRPDPAGTMPVSLAAKRDADRFSRFDLNQIHPDDAGLH